MLNIAHRGSSGLSPENTLCAFTAALAEGADMCELDVRRSADGVLIVIHDDTVERTTDGAGKVAAMTFAELRLLDAGAWRGPGFAGERIPALTEVFDLTRGRCGLNLELKAAGLEVSIGQLVRAQRAEETTVISSFDWAVLAEVRRIAPALRVALLASRWSSRLLDTAVAMRAFAINPRFDLISVDRCVAAHDRGLQVHAWTVDDPVEMQKLARAGVDGTMTNYPARLRAVLES